MGTAGSPSREWVLSHPVLQGTAAPTVAILLSSLNLAMVGARWNLLQWVDADSTFRLRRGLEGDREVPFPAPDAAVLPRHRGPDRLVRCDRVPRDRAPVDRPEEQVASSAG